MKRKNDFVIEQPCCGCIFFNKCGSVSNATPFHCDKTIIKPDSKTTFTIPNLRPIIA